MWTGEQRRAAVVDRGLQRPAARRRSPRPAPGSRRAAIQPPLCSSRAGRVRRAARGAKTPITAAGSAPRRGRACAAGITSAVIPASASAGRNCLASPTMIVLACAGSNSVAATARDVGRRSPRRPWPSKRRVRPAARRRSPSPASRPASPATVSTDRPKPPVSTAFCDGQFGRRRPASWPAASSRRRSAPATSGGGRVLGRGRRGQRADAAPRVEAAVRRRRRARA